jgi:hypothetical protein
VLADDDSSSGLRELGHLRSLTITGDRACRADVGLFACVRVRVRVRACACLRKAGACACGPVLCGDAALVARAPPRHHHHHRAGGLFSAAAAERLLRCLAHACPLLEELRLLPQPTCGLGDDQVHLLLQLSRLKVRARRCRHQGGLQGARAAPAPDRALLCRRATSRPQHARARTHAPAGA